MPHGSEHILENAIEESDTDNLYETIHSSDFNTYCRLWEIPDGDYDLFMLADDATELDSITFEVK